MTFEKIFWVAMAVLTLVVLPMWTAFSVRQHLRAVKRGDTNKHSERSRVAIGNALQELDRLVARPAWSSRSKPSGRSSSAKMTGAATEACLVNGLAAIDSPAIGAERNDFDRQIRPQQQHGQRRLVDTWCGER